MSDPFIGEIAIFGFNFAPKGWAFCEGQLLPISQNEALFSLLGTTYGGDGRTTFGLPNLNGRIPIGQGKGSGLSHRLIGEMGGVETLSLTTNNLPNNPVSVKVATDTATKQVAAEGDYLASQDPHGTISTFIDGNTTPNTVNLGGISGGTGANQPLQIMNPFLALNFSIALFGIYPSRN